MKITAATFGDLVYVIDNLSDQSKDEQKVLGNTPWHTLMTAKAWLQHGAVTVWWEGNPGFIFGITPTGLSWFLAAQAYFDGGIRAIREGRRFVKWMCIIRGGGFTTFSRSPHPDTERWFRLMGMRQGNPIDDIKVWHAGVTTPLSLASVASSERQPGSRRPGTLKG